MKNSLFYRTESNCWNRTETGDFSCQVNQYQYRNTICTCRRHKKTQIVYNNSEQSAIDLGIVRVKLARRKKIVVYLPDNKGVLNITKKISSKCVGSCVPVQNIGENLENIYEIGTLQEDYELNKSEVQRSHLKNVKQGNISKRDQKDINANVRNKILNYNKEAKNLDNFSVRTKAQNSFSSNSSIERIYNLESTSDDSKNLLHSERHNEDNLQGCNSLSLKDNCKNSISEQATSNLKRPTILEKANEILKQGLSWVRENPKDLRVGVNLSKTIHKDVSITFSPPSLIARSFSSTKVLSQKVSFENPCKTEVLEDLNKKGECIKKESKVEGVKAMFRLWEKNFNFEDKKNKPKTDENYTKGGNKTSSREINYSKDTPTKEPKKSKKIFSFFRKKKKEKKVNSFKGEKITAGRCELSDGIVIKVGLNKSISNTSSFLEKASNNNNIVQEPWLRNFISNSRDSHSQKSVQIRWDNKLYGTSCNTVSELKNHTFKEAAIILKSKSDIEPNACLEYDKRKKHNLNFKQNIKACMMPNTICQIPVNKRVSSQINNSSFAVKCKKFKGQTKKHIKIFLPARNFSGDSIKSLDFITIQIPGEYFSEESEDQIQYTDEEVYNIVEYESLKSKSVLKDEQFYTGDHLHSKTKEKKQTTVQTCKEVVIQASNCVPKVKEIGVSAQRDMICFRKSIIPQDNPTKSPHLQSQRKCDLAEAYLRDYYRNIMPLGLDLFTPQTSKSQWQLISLNSSVNSSNSHNLMKVTPKSSAVPLNESSKIKECKQIHTEHFFSKLRKITCRTLPPCNIRTCPKDSIEVCKRRKIYACSNKSKWGDSTEETDTKKSTHSTASYYKNHMGPCVDSDERPLDGILKFKGISDCSNCKNNEKITKKTTTVIPDPICLIPGPPCLDECTSIKNPMCTKASLPTCHTQSPECISQKSKDSQMEQSKTKVTQTKSRQVTPRSSHPISLNTKNSDVKSTVDSPVTCFCSGDENILPIAISESEETVKQTLTGSSVLNNPPPMLCPLDPNSYCCCKPICNSFITESNSKRTFASENKNTTATFYQNSLVNVKRRCNCIGKKNTVTSKRVPEGSSYNTDIKKTSNDFQSETNDTKDPVSVEGVKPPKSSRQSNSNSNGQINEKVAKPFIKSSKQSNVNAKSLAESLKQSINDTDDPVSVEGAILVPESSRQFNNDFGQISENKEKPSTRSSRDGEKSIRPLIKSPKQSNNDTEDRVSKESRNLGRVKTEKGDSITDKKIVRTKSESIKENKIEGVNRNDLLKDVYKETRDGTNVPIQPIQVAKEQENLKSLDVNSIQRKVSVSDIIEINICLKFRNPETSKAKITPHHAYNVDTKSDIQNITTSSTQIYQVYEKEGNHINGQTKDINFALNIQTIKSKCNLLNEHNQNNYSTTTTKRDNSHSEHLLHNHQAAPDFTNSLNKIPFTNMQIANFEMSCGTGNFASSKTTDSSLTNDNISDGSSSINANNTFEISGNPSNYKQEVINEIQENFENTKDALSIDESIKDIVNRKLVSILKKLSKYEKNEVMKQILETIGNMKAKNKTKHVNRIKHLMYAVLTSESDLEHVNDVKSRSTSSIRKHSNKSSKSKSFLLHEGFSGKSFNLSTEKISRESIDVEYARRKMKEKIKRIIGFNRTGCSCSKKVDINSKHYCRNKIEKHCCCINVEGEEACGCTKMLEVDEEVTKTEQSLGNQMDDKKIVKSPQNSHSSIMGSILMTETYEALQIESEIVNASTKKVSASPKNIRRTKQDKFVYLASDKVLFFLSDSNDSYRSNINRKPYNRLQDTLQLRKTKRAVLKIYSQRNISNSVIKLPKFVSHR